MHASRLETITPPEDDSPRSRRLWWTAIMDQAVSSLDEILAMEAVDGGEAMVSLPDAAAAAGVEVTFSDRPHVEGLPRLFYLRAGQIEGFLGAARAMNARGWRMHVEDGYRTRRMQRGLGLAANTLGVVIGRVRWELGGGSIKPSAELVFRRCQAMVALYPRTGTHMSGSAIDISVYSRSDGSEIDRGGPYLEMSELTAMDSPFITPAQRANRRAITAIMADHGFTAYPYEFWHYNGGDAFASWLSGGRRPVRYGPIDFDPATGEVKPLADPAAPLVSLKDMKAALEIF